MTDKEKIKEEIERIKKESLEGKKNYYDYYDGVGDACDEILQFTDSLPEEPASDDLEEELHSWMRKNCDDNGFFNPLELARHFAEWQREKDDKHIGDLQWEAYLKGEQDTKQQMMKDALDGCVLLIVKSDTFSRNLFISTPQLYKELQKYKHGDKLKIIIVKED